MSDIRFEWDDTKNRTNLQKHGISFEEASTVFVDELALIIPDPGNSSEEERFIILGMSLSLRMVVVCHCYRENGETIRIISARQATRNEKRTYVDRR